MGRVWRATDVVLHRDVAIKELVPPPGLTIGERQEMRERSLREARAIARLNNVNVVRVFDVLRTDADPWIVMEYVPSRSLQDILASDGPFTSVRAAEIGLGMLNALRAAHRAGVVHRDVKPGNVLLGEDGRVVLTDFGLATVPGDPNVTRTGLVLGSPAYIAPERARDGTAGPSADLWSLGATLYAAVEGQSPFARPSAIATLAALATENPPPARNAGPLKAVLNGLLRKDPAHRINADEAERLLLRATGRRAKLTFPMSPTMRRPGAGRDRSALPFQPPVVPGGGFTATGSAPVVPGPRPPVSPARPPVSQGRPPVAPTRPPAGPPVSPGHPPIAPAADARPVFTPGKATVGRRPVPETPTRVDRSRTDVPARGERPGADAHTRVDRLAEPPRLDATRVDTPPVRDARRPGRAPAGFATPPPPPHGIAAPASTPGAGETLRGSRADEALTADEVAAHRRRPAARIEMPAPPRPGGGTDSAPPTQRSERDKDSRGTSAATSERKVPATAPSQPNAQPAAAAPGQTVDHSPSGGPSVADGDSTSPGSVDGDSAGSGPADGNSADAASAATAADAATGTRIRPDVTDAGRGEQSGAAAPDAPSTPSGAATAKSAGAARATKAGATEDPQPGADAAPKASDTVGAEAAKAAKAGAQTSAASAPHSETQAPEDRSAEAEATEAQATEAQATEKQPAEAGQAADQAAKPKVGVKPTVGARAGAGSSSKASRRKARGRKAGKAAETTAADRTAVGKASGDDADGSAAAPTAAAAEAVTKDDAATAGDAATTDDAATKDDAATIGDAATTDDAATKDGAARKAGTPAGEVSAASSEADVPSAEETSAAGTRTGEPDGTAAQQLAADATTKVPTVEASRSGVPLARTAMDQIGSAGRTGIGRRGAHLSGDETTVVPPIGGAQQPFQSGPLSTGSSGRPAWQPMPTRAPSAGARGLTVLGTTLTRRQTAIGGAILLALLLVVALIVHTVVGGDDAKAKDPGRKAAISSAGPAASAPAQPAPAPSQQTPSQTPSTTPPTSSTPSAVSGVPDGWYLYRDSDFSLPLPNGAQVKHPGNELQVRWNNRLLLIDVIDQPSPDPVADSEAQEGMRRGYQKVRLDPVKYFLKAADWEYFYTTNRNNRQHVLKRTFLTSPDQGFSVGIYAVPEDWGSASQEMQIMLNGFKPAS
ncbi:hypothetical protein KRMM14A1259_35120 [Krasilnikovia sp. MM14-A1259]